ncbi:hypothetical protein CWI38_2351p0010, partial [Hamiltosporidium tvaerminnensis]
MKYFPTLKNQILTNLTLAIIPTAIFIKFAIVFLRTYHLLFCKYNISSLKYSFTQPNIISLSYQHQGSTIPLNTSIKDIHIATQSASDTFTDQKFISTFASSNIFLKRRQEIKFESNLKITSLNKQNVLNFLKKRNHLHFTIKCKVILHLFSFEFSFNKESTFSIPPPASEQKGTYKVTEICLKNVINLDNPSLTPQKVVTLIDNTDIYQQKIVNFDDFLTQKNTTPAKSDNTKNMTEESERSDKNPIITQNQPQNTNNLTAECLTSDKTSNTTQNQSTKTQTENNTTDKTPNTIQISISPNNLQFSPFISLYLQPLCITINNTPLFTSNITITKGVLHPFKIYIPFISYKISLSIIKGVLFKRLIINSIKGTLNNTIKTLFNNTDITHMIPNTSNTTKRNNNNTYYKIPNIRFNLHSIKDNNIVFSTFIHNNIIPLDISLITNTKNVSSEISNNTKIKVANDADEVKKSDSEIQKCKLHPPAIPLPSSSYTTITPPPPSQTCSKMQNSGLDTLPSPNAPVPSSVEVSACEPSYDMTSPCTLAIPEGNRLMALRTIFDSVTADPKEWPRIVFFAVQTRFERMPRNGWTELHRYYNEKFGCTETLEV